MKVTLPPVVTTVELAAALKALGTKISRPTLWRRSCGINAWSRCIVDRNAHFTYWSRDKLIAEGLLPASVAQDAVSASASRNS